MTLDEAIKKLEDIVAGDLELGRDEFVEAERLGIAALKRCRHNYLDPQCADFRRLPGETK